MERRHFKENDIKKMQNVLQNYVHIIYEVIVWTLAKEKGKKMQTWAQMFGVKISTEKYVE